jgi:hypothetical protein
MDESNLYYREAAHQRIFEKTHGLLVLRSIEQRETPQGRAQKHGGK